jgi:hypothetical protein
MSSITMTQISRLFTFALLFFCFVQLGAYMFTSSPWRCSWYNPYDTVSSTPFESNAAVVAVENKKANLAVVSYPVPP